MATDVERQRKHRAARRAERAITRSDPPALSGKGMTVTDWGAHAAEVAETAARHLLDRMPEMSGRDLAIAYGIAVDKHLDYTQGRKAGVTVDQSQHLALPPGTTLDDLRALRDQLRLAQPPSAPPETASH